ncbi:MAG: dethiobiotin synthase [Desulfarculaceae bacterium]|nr:dethiobiotin synthase [Desulfarculaceae bacterium]MCF8072773.1 dethiobiotin synthase [Desulfarculaceae bacterium]MCF8100941.1 dethiobiotin synthase [Desulfarculaceae bacterium]MCF8117575.1 dethiobiotin synthase [Desulfarculaceae bacterium]
MSGRGVMVIGTDTEVGKTMISAALVLGLKAAGVKVGYLKPLASDCAPTPDGPLSPDVALVHRLAGLPEPAVSLNPVCLAAPLSPLAAARAEGVELDLAAPLASCRAFLAAHDYSVIEGVGGLLVPIAPGMTFLELAEALGLPVVVAARPLLGTINHTLLTIEALRRREVPVVGFAFSAGAPLPEDDPSVAGNHALIAEFSGAPYLGTLPHLGLAEAITAEALTQAATQNLDLSLLPPV